MISSQDLLTDITAYCEISNPVGSYANIAAAIFFQVPQLNWVGFYFDDGKKLRLGPFQGKPACTEIGYNRGVCGASFTQQKLMLVNDVDNFPDHIVCDTASKSEVVVPLFKDKQIFGVLDVDSPVKNRFSEQDQLLFDKIGQIISQHLDNYLQK